ncbi:tRNA glutamyl-Q(34) synthetase GluQRS [Massilia sp. W12]|uniref:tRNA glutamyl-Q(34) synthetase GluQRS n=1 Tax=Massilia sp. W12 TaxID=3126507 RepID=UPI0030CEDA3E
MLLAPYVGRFAPSPTGALHAGSLVTALGSFLDARAHDGRWLLRIEDVDEARSVAGAEAAIIEVLGQLGMHSDGPILRQSERKQRYAEACARLGTYVYPCACSRSEIALSSTLRAADGAPLYAGTCRQGLPPGKSGRSLRLRVPDAPHDLITFNDRHLGPCQQALASEVGDFVLRRVEGYWAYQLAVVVDDAEQGVSDVVRGMDLLDSSARQLYLQDLLGYARPRYLHLPLVVNAGGEKLSKQTGAAPILPGADEASRLALLQQAAGFLQLDTVGADSLAAFWRRALQSWRARWVD